MQSLSGGLLKDSGFLLPSVADVRNLRACHCGAAVRLIDIRFLRGWVVVPTFLPVRL